MTIEECAYEIIPGLWVSGMPGASWPLLEWEVSLIVSLSDHLPPQAGRRFQWGTNGEALGEGKIIYLHWPIEDGDLPEDEMASILVETIMAALRKKKKVLLHCYEGRNRSGLLAALVVRKMLNLSGKEALDFIRQKKPGMLYNRKFAEYLEGLNPPS